MTWLDRFRKAADQYAVPGAVAALLASFVATVVWVPLWAILINVADELYMAVFGRALHWLPWVLLWVCAIARVIVWGIKELADMDQSDRRP